ncbi:Aldedh-domain-containing protein [Meira miltonrushii]|uniref:Aldedh-domain-containing protein n=1 Tax=Meira miltonrushii TaxID=1280837 RepID=A0A316VCJ5_9BASI|nr:Aldedh-domain-containing protein [Meira miltonrushii]PWN35387.1 Aldedh-domain-containing protein [Meira miltonrushii]
MTETTLIFNTSMTQEHIVKVALTFFVTAITVFALPLIVTSWRETPPSLEKVDIPSTPEAAKHDWKPTNILDRPSIVPATRDNVRETRSRSTKNSNGTKGSDVDTIVAYCPATGAYLDEIVADSEASIDAKVRKALMAQEKTWQPQGRNWTQRRRVLKTIKAWMVRDMDTLVRVACRDTGKTAIDAVLGEILVTLSKLDWLIKNSEKVLRPQTRPNNLLLAHKRCTVYYEPVGVVTALVSWNYPCHNALSPILAGLASGNAVVVKCSEMVVWSTQYYIQGVHACLRACGLSPDLVQLVCCLPPVAPVLTSHPLVRHLTFIGSESVAKMVARDAAKVMTPCCLELGGKDPMIVLEDASLSFFVQTWLRAAFGSGGQNCIGAERFIVSRKIMQKFLDLVTPKVKILRQGSFLDDVAPGTKQGIDVGAMISDNRFDALEALIADAESRGARVLAGGKRFNHPNHPSGHYFAPTLIVDVTPDMPIAQEELFAPIFLVMPFDTVEEAVSLANGTRFALGSSVFGSNRSVCRKVADQLHAGMVNINDFAVSYLNQGLPFGGNKASGNGQRFGGPEGLLALCNTKAVTEDRFFSLIKTAIPGPVHYPHADSLKAYAFVVGLATFFGAVTWGESLVGLWSLIRSSL